MKRFFYPRLAFNNIKKNAKVYIPYILTSIFTIALFYIMLSLSNNPGLDKTLGGSSLITMLFFGVVVIAIFSAIFLFYTNSFLIRRRKKEIALYNILGMEKRHISKMLSYEAIITTLFSLSIGIVLGMILSKLLFLLLLNIINIDTTLTFSISISGIYITCLLFSAIFLITLLSTILQIHIVNPIELLSGSKSGEKEPKSRWIFTTIGLLTLLAGYYISLTITSPLDALGMFFVAVILVIIGTYSLFVSGSITILKLLKKNKRIYYRTKYFTAISGMLYRMKQNAVGLANICILSTCVIVILSTTISLYAGIEDSLKTRYVYDIIVEVDQIEPSTNIEAIYQEEVQEYQVSTKDVTQYQDTIIYSNKKDNTFSSSGAFYSGTAIIHLQTLDQYNQMNNKNMVLGNNEVLAYKVNDAFKSKTVTLMNQKYTTKEIEKPNMLFDVQNLIDNYLFVLPNQTAYDSIVANTPECSTPYIFAFNFASDQRTENDISFIKDFNSRVEAEVSTSDVGARELSRDDFQAMYGGMFFLGIFLGILFLMIVSLIIYYKQISEGYEDVDRYKIMQKVGMSKKEVKTSINLQILLVFFLPLLVSIVHFSFAFGIITKLLSLLNLTNVSLFMVSSCATIVIFALLYSTVYYITSKLYYRIVN